VFNTASMDTSRFRVERDAWPDDLLPREPTFPMDGAPVHEHVRRQARERPDDPALTFYGRTLSWREFDDHVSRFAAALHDRGHAGDVCALYLQNCPQFYVAYFGAHRAGLTVAPLNPQLRDVALEFLLADNGASALVTHPDQLSTVAAVEDGVPLRDTFVVQYREYASVEDAPIPVHEVVADEAPVPDGRQSFAAAVADAEPRDDLPEPDPEDRALLQYTGGTTGMPKGCVHTHWNVTYKAVVRSQAPTEGAVQLAVMPVFHVAGKVGAVDAPATVGRHVVVLPRYTAESMMAAIDAYGATSTWLTVPMAQEILDHPDRDEYDLTSLSANRDAMTATSFGTNITETISERWAELTGARLTEGGYGLSETHTGDAHTAGLDRVEPGFVGQPTYGVEVEIRDFETNEPLPTGEEGEIVLYTPSTMEGYHDRPEATAEVLEADGALHTGDVGRRTEEGFLYFLGRRKDALKVSGHTLSPREVEYALEESGLVRDALVVGKPHETRGNVPEAHVIPADGVEGSEAEAAILEWAGDHLAEFKRPANVVVRESFPRTDLGKVDRKRYREQLPDEYA
jgi:long-chain acyl-CoA synthetase